MDFSLHHPRQHMLSFVENFPVLAGLLAQWKIRQLQAVF